MAKFQAVQKIRMEDLTAAAGKDGLPGWVEPLITPINAFMDTVSIALKNGLTFDENFNCVLKSIDFTHATEVIIDPQTTKTIVGVLPLTTGALRIENFGFRFPPTQTRQLAVTVGFSGGVSTTKGTCLLLILTK